MAKVNTFDGQSLVDWMVIDMINHSRRRSLVHVSRGDGFSNCGLPIPHRANIVFNVDEIMECMRCTRRKWGEMFSEDEQAAPIPIRPTGT